MQERYRRPVTFEEAMWLWPGEKARDPKGIGLWPRERSFILPPGLYPERTPVLDQSVLRRILDAYHSQTDGPRFRVLSSSYALHIVPTKARDASGALVEVRSALDALIDLPVASRTPADHIMVFCKAVTEASGITVKPFAPWLDQFFAPHGFIPPREREMTEEERRMASIVWGGRMRARDALISLLEESDTTLTWGLRCSAEPWDYNCLLNLMPIQVRVTRPDGTIGRIYITHDRSKSPRI